MSTEPFPTLPHTTARFPSPARMQESGPRPLKALHMIGYNPNQAVRGSIRKDDQRWVEPGTLFMPVSAVERAELLARTAAAEPTADEVRTFG